MMYTTDPVGVTLRPRRLGIAYLWWILLGTFGAHRFYLRSRGVGRFMLVFAIIGLVVGTFFALGTWFDEGEDPTGALVGLPFLGVVWIWDIVDVFLMPRLVRTATRRQLLGSAPATTWPNSAGFVRGGYRSADRVPKVTGSGLRPDPDDLVKNTVWEDLTGKYWRAIGNPAGRYGNTRRIWTETWPIPVRSFVANVTLRLAGITIGVLACLGFAIVSAARGWSTAVLIAFLAVFLGCLAASLRASVIVAYAFPEVAGRAEAKDWPDPAASLKRVWWSGLATGRKIPKAAEEGWTTLPVGQIGHDGGHGPARDAAGLADAGEIGQDDPDR